MTANRNDTMARLEAVLDTCGGDPARWPGTDRPALERLIAADPEAARLHAESRALDRMMAHAPAGEATPGLAARIVAAAVADRGRPARVVPIEALRHGRGPNAARSPARRLAPAAALLAASFAFGIYLGASIVDQTAFGAALDIATLDADGAGVDDLLYFPDALGPDPEGTL